MTKGEIEQYIAHHSTADSVDWLFEEFAKLDATIDDLYDEIYALEL